MDDVYFVVNFKGSSVVSDGKLFTHRIEAEDYVKKNGGVIVVGWVPSASAVKNTVTTKRS